MHMKCLRCGKETGSEQVFCAACLEEAKAYPVSPGAAVHLPDRSAYVRKRPAHRRRLLSPEEQVQQLRRSVRSLVIAVVALSIVLGITAGLLLHSLLAPTASTSGNLGRNYTSEDIG